MSKRCKIDDEGLSVGRRACPASLASLASAVLALVFSHLNVRDHASMARANRASSSVCRLRESSPAEYTRHHHASSPPAWLAPRTLVFQILRGDMPETRQLHDLCACMCRSLTSLDVQTDFRTPLRIDPSLVDFKSCTGLRTLRLGLVALPAAVLSETWRCMPLLTELRLAALDGKEAHGTLANLPTTLTCLQVPASADNPRGEVDLSLLSRLTRLESLDTGSQFDHVISVAELHRLLPALGASVRCLHLGRLYGGLDVSVLPRTLTEFGCVLRPSRTALQFPAVLRRLRLDLWFARDDADHEAIAAGWISAVPAHVDFLVVRFHDIGRHISRHYPERVPTDVPDSISYLDHARVLFALPCAASLQSLHLRDAYRFCRPDSGRWRGICDGFETAFASLTSLTLSGVSHDHSGGFKAPLIAVLGLPALPGLRALDLGNVGGVEPYTTRVASFGCYAEFAASPDRPSECLVEQICARYPLLESLSLPTLVPVPVPVSVAVPVSGDDATGLKPPGAPSGDESGSGAGDYRGECEDKGECKGDRKGVTRSLVHEAYRLVFMVKSIGRLTKLRHLDARGLAMMPACAIREFALRPPPRLSLLTLLQPANTDRQTIRADLAWRGIELRWAWPKTREGETDWRPLESVLRVD